METTSSSNVRRSNLQCESASQRAARETDPTAVVTCSCDVSRVESTSSIVRRPRTRGGSSSAAIPDVEMRPETDTRSEPEMENPAEIQVSCLLSVRKVRTPLDRVSPKPLVSM